MTCVGSMNPFFPENVAVTINGSTVTTQIFEFIEDGGETNTTFIKTIGRGYKLITNPPSDYNIQFSATDVNNTLSNLFDTYRNKPIEISLDWSGSRTITYNEARFTKMKYELKADGRLLLQLNFLAPFYNLVGSVNRVVE